MPEEIQKIQIFGERCSGTNYLECLLSKNFPTLPLCSDFGYKHFFPEKDFGNSPDCLFIVIYRSPFDWLKSIYRNPWLAAPEFWRLSFSEFIRKEWKCVWDKHAKISRKDPRYGTEMLFERNPETGQRFRNIIDLRSAKIRVWENARKNAVTSIAIQYEQLRSDPERFIQKVSSRSRIAPEPFFHDISRYKGAKWYQGWISRILRKKVPALNQTDIQFIATQLNHKLEESIGYNIHTLVAELEKNLQKPMKNS